LDSLALYWI